MDQGKETLKNQGNSQNQDQEKSRMNRMKNAIRKRTALYLVIAALILFLGGVFVASLFFMRGIGEIESVDNVGAPGFDKGQTGDYAQGNRRVCSGLNVLFYK